MAAVAALINNLCHAKTPGALRRVQGPWGRGAPFFDNVPTASYRGGWGVMMEKQGRRSWR